MVNSNSILRLGMAQIAPVWLNKEETIEKILAQIEAAAINKCELLVFGVLDDELSRDWALVAQS